jgi:hypothetical protein
VPWPAHGLRQLRRQQGEQRHGFGRGTYRYFADPLQVAIMLSKPGEEFDGRESVFVEQRPRPQSRAIIARPAQGQGIVFPVRHRPVHGSHGYRRHAMRHCTGDVTRGNRTVLGITFHNAR